MCGDYNLRREKRYVEVDVRFTPDGKIRPLAINYDKAHTYGIDRVLAVKHGTSRLGGKGHCFAQTAFCPATGFIKIHIIIHGSAHWTSYIFFSHSITSQKNAKQTQSHTKITPKGCYLWIWFDYTPTLWRCQLRICLHFRDFLLISYIFYTIIELPDHKGVFLL